MENHVYDCYEVKLSRFFNLLTEKNSLWLLCAAGIAFIVLLAGVLIPKVGLGKAAVIVLLDALVLLAKALSYPRLMDVTPGTVKFSRRKALLTLLLYGRIRLTVLTPMTIPYITSPRLNICKTILKSAFTWGGCAFTVWQISKRERTASPRRGYIPSAA